MKATLFVAMVALFGLSSISQAGTGACCLGEYCQVGVRELCEAEDGKYMGDGSTCQPNPCVSLGACCDRYGFCGITTETACIAESGWWDEGAPCEPNPCVGACCNEGGTCRVTSAYLCEIDETGSEYQGSGTDCDPNPCIPHIGACCYGDQQCAVVTRFQCVEDCGCDYQGDGTTCDPDPCTATPTENRSWGAIKAAYR